jgi:peptide/nickel transport system substrate-binding protein
VPSSKSRRIAVSIGAGVLSLLLASCTGTPAPAPASSSAVPTSSAPAAPTATFTFGTAAQPLGLDPALASDVESYRITRQVLEGLVGVDQTTGLPTPLLATEWAESSEGRA